MPDNYSYTSAGKVKDTRMSGAQMNGNSQTNGGVRTNGGARIGGGAHKTATSANAAKGQNFNPQPANQSTANPQNPVNNHLHRDNHTGGVSTGNRMNDPANNVRQNRNVRNQNISRNDPTRQNNSGTTGGGMSVAPRNDHRQAAPVQTTRFSVIKKIFAVDKTVIERRDIVREKGSFDYGFLIIILLLLLFGTVMVYSASYVSSGDEYNGDSYYIIFKQLVFATAGLIAMAIVMHIDPKVFKAMAVPAYIFCFFMLTLVPFIGVAHKGAKRWLNVGIEIQPSEFMKLGLVLMLAWYIDRYYERINSREPHDHPVIIGIIAPYLIVGVTCALIVIEKHLSGTIIMFMIGTIMIFASGASLKILGIMGATGLTGLALLALLYDHARARVITWLNPETDPLGAGWQILQGYNAIGSGGIFGEGLGDGIQKHLFVSEPQNDFIFTIICEELGFVGALAVILLFAIFVWRGIVIASNAPDVFSSMVVYGIVGKVAVQTFLNIAVVTGTVPNTGISLPFFSYGGSSLCVLLVEMGIVLSISRFSKQKK